MIKTEHGSHQKLSCFGYRSRRHGADAACIRNPPSHQLSLQEEATSTSTREEAGLEVTHSCSCSGFRSSSCSYPCGVGKTSPKLDPVPTSWLKSLGPHNSSGLTLSSNALSLAVFTDNWDHKDKLSFLYTITQVRETRSLRAAGSRNRTPLQTLLSVSLFTLCLINHGVASNSGNT